MSKIAITEQMVGRFLSWPLPTDFAPDCGITFTRSPHAGMNPTGTNLLHFGQAKAMLEHCINGGNSSVGALPPHQQRVLDEKQELDIRITRLDEFILRNALFRQLDPDEQACMRRQLDVMRELSVILGERISAF
ncbi:hypothetical protein QYQ99_03115 [Comamonas testosteroni]|uniref:crAss001_48 related protein n=1 Tax=Comamonas testosteroni TaxID=285 RepID=UPI00265EBA7F|nr:hypothetical protein [Comamonas testosteroni]WKL16560.1 hypothetical protein QYQ99_03115 [Comamonas testosteroni]